MTTLQKTPVWFLDIDGVINGDTRKPRYFPDWTKVVVPADTPAGIIKFPIHYSPTVIKFINEMAKQVQIVWLTTWAHQANTKFAPAVGIQGTFPEGFELAHINVDGFNYQGWGGMIKAKSHAVTVLSQDLFAGRPVIWTDDQALKHIRKSVESSLLEGTPSLLIDPPASIGINPNLMNRIADFVKTHTGNLAND